MINSQHERESKDEIFDFISALLFLTTYTGPEPGEQMFHLCVCVCSSAPSNALT